MKINFEIIRKYANKNSFLIVMLLFSNIMFAQNQKVTSSAKDKVISGSVVDTKGEAIVGASVLSEGTKKGTITDLNGKFTLTVNENSTLIVSYIGYNKTAVPVNGKNTIKIVLTEDAKILDDVVVVGYGQQRRKDVTGSLGRVEITDMIKAPVGNFTDALSGRVAGVVVSAPDGQPGSAPTIIIRGAGSVTQDNSPLWVVDGFPIENYNNNAINPNDIESINILKDASATAIYGARGSNGVILLTTKKGKLGAPIVNFNTSVFSYEINKKMPVMNAQQYLQYQIDRDNAAKNYAKDANGGIVVPVRTNTESMYFTYAPNGLADYADKTVDLQDYMFRKAYGQSYNLSISGGSDKTKYFVSGNFLNQDGIMINTGFQRVQGKVVLDQNINDRVKLGINVNYSRNLQNGSSPLASNTPLYSTSVQSPFTNLWGARPVTPLQSDGSSFDLINGFQDQQFTDGSVTNSLFFNPVVNQKNAYNVRTTDNLTANGYLNIAFTPELSLRSTLGYVTNATEADVYYGPKTSQGSPLTNSGQTKGSNGSINNYIYSSWSNENILTYNKTIQKRHYINLTGLVSEQGGTLKSYGLSSIFCPNPDLLVSGLDEGTPVSNTSTASLWTLASFMARLNYNYDSRYYITFSNRFDGSSKFAQDRQWGNFSSGALKWSFANEKFMKSIKNTVSSGAFRYSLGQTGNNRVSDFASYSTMTIGTMVAPYVFNNTIPAQAIAGVTGNPTVQWETTTQSNVGIDLGLFKDRILIVADYYLKKTDNLLLNKSASPTSGYPNVMANIGSLENSGVELSINTVNVRNKNFEWTSSFNISWNRNKVLSLGNGQIQRSDATGFDGSYLSTPSYISKVGQPIGQFYGLVWDGNYQNGDFNYLPSLNPSALNVGAAGSHWLLKDNVPTNGTARASIQPGDIKYKDLNGDGVIDANDYTVIGRGLPIHTGGFGNNFKFYNFDLNIFFQWSYGNNIQNANRMVFEGNGGKAMTYLNQFASYVDHWTPTNTSSPNYRIWGQGNPGMYSSRTIEDGSYLRFKTLSLGYNVPADFLKKLKLKDFRISFSAQNLLTLTRYSGFDPEVSSYNSVLTPGFDWSAYPKGRTYALGIDMKF
ncbi:MAG: TonB-dependent receptor [Paludibacter sp.]